MSAIPARPVRPVTVIELSDDLQRHGESLTTHSILLQDDLQRQFRLPVGPCEALGIKVVLENRLVSRPITHDLILNLLTRLGGEVAHIEIDQAGKNWRAKVSLRASAGLYVVEAGHGDAIALALRANAPIFATEAVITGEEPPP